MILAKFQQQLLCKIFESLHFFQNQLVNLVDLKKCWKTRICLQRSVPIQPKTSQILCIYFAGMLTKFRDVAPRASRRRGRRPARSTGARAAPRWPREDGAVVRRTWICLQPRDSIVCHRASVHNVCQNTSGTSINILYKFAQLWVISALIFARRYELCSFFKSTNSQLNFEGLENVQLI